MSLETVQTWPRRLSAGGQATSETEPGFQRCAIGGSLPVSGFPFPLRTGVDGEGTLLHLAGGGEGTQVCSLRSNRKGLEREVFTGWRSREQVGSPRVDTGQGPQGARRGSGGRRCLCELAWCSVSPRLHGPPARPAEPDLLTQLQHVAVASVSSHSRDALRQKSAFDFQVCVGEKEMRVILTLGDVRGTALSPDSPLKSPLPERAPHSPLTHTQTGGTHTPASLRTGVRRHRTPGRPCAGTRAAHRASERPSGGRTE